MNHIITYYRRKKLEVKNRLMTGAEQIPVYASQIVYEERKKTGIDKKDKDIKSIHENQRESNISENASEYSLANQSTKSEGKRRDSNTKLPKLYSLAFSEIFDSR
jgi:hypothetical protein